MHQLGALLLGGVALSIVHALIPNHWVPFVLLGRSQRWPRARLVGITALGGFFHVLSTVLIGVFIGFAGYQLSQNQRLYTHLIAPAILGGLGVALLLADWLGRGHRHKHILEYEHDHAVPGDNGHPHSHAPARLSARQANISVAGIIAAMFFSPCIELEAYYFVAGAGGWLAIGALSLVYMVVTVGLMVALVITATERFGDRLHFLEHHERLVVGLVFLALAAGAYVLS